jgi:hypothetical protein
MLCGNAVPAVTYDHGGGMRSLPEILLGMSRLATLLLSLGPAKLAAPQLDLHVKRVPLIMRYR